MSAMNAFPENIATVRFKMIFKNKGSYDDPSRYRYILDRTIMIILARILDWNAKRNSSKTGKQVSEQTEAAETTRWC